jgi:hypothetical protein
MATPTSLTLTDEQLAALLEQATKVTDPNDKPAESAPLRYRLGDQQFEAKTPEEMQAQLDAVMQRVNATVQQLQQQAAAPAPAADKKDAPAFDRERYAELFLKDPLAAADYLDEIRFGMQQPTKVLKTVIQDVGAMEQSLAVQQFMSAAGDYEPTPENFRALSETMAAYALPWNFNGLKLAYTQAKADGRIRTSDDAEPSGQMLSGRRAAPVAPRGGQMSSAAVDADVLARFETMTPDKMKAFLEGLPGS